MPLKKLNEGYRGLLGEGLNIVQLVEELGEWLELLRDVAVKMG